MVQRNKLLFLFFFLILVIDRVLTLLHFGFQYTDIDQVLQWEGALDYADGIFREPFFYGQNYNFMVESLVAVPLLWLKVPVYMAVPIATSFLAIFPFVVLAIFFQKRNRFLWAYFSLIFPVLLPLDYNLLTTMPRGFMQAGLFLPLMYFAIFDPKEKRSASLFFIGAGACFLANPGSVLLIVPIGMYLFYHQYSSKAFYLKGLWLLPFLFFLWWSNNYYHVHPEKLLYKIEKIDLQISSLLDMLKRKNLFEFLLPFQLRGVFVVLALALMSFWLGYKKRQKEFLFVFFALVMVLVSLSVPKVTRGDIESGIFYSPSRLFVQLPLLLFLVAYLFFGNKSESESKSISQRAGYFVLIFIGCVSLGFKNYNVVKKVEKTVARTTFAVEKLSELVPRVELMDGIAKKHQVDVIVTDPIMGWPYAFESFTYRSIMQMKTGKKPRLIAVHNTIDRRSWLYEEAQIADRVVLYMIFPEEENLNAFDHKNVGLGMTLIYNNTLPLDKLFERLKVTFGNKAIE